MIDNYDLELVHYTESLSNALEQLQQESTYEFVRMPFAERASEILNSAVIINDTRSTIAEGSVGQHANHTLTFTELCNNLEEKTSLTSDEAQELAKYLTDILYATYNTMNNDPSLRIEYDIAFFPAFSITEYWHTDEFSSGGNNPCLAPDLNKHIAPASLKLFCNILMIYALKGPSTLHYDTNKMLVDKSLIETCYNKINLKPEYLSALYPSEKSDNCSEVLNDMEFSPQEIITAPKGYMDIFDKKNSVHSHPATGAEGRLRFAMHATSDFFKSFTFNYTQSQRNLLLNQNK